LANAQWVHRLGFLLDSTLLLLPFLLQGVPVVAIILAYVAVVRQFLQRQDYYIKRTRKLVTMFPPDVIAQVEGLRRAVTSYVQAGGNA
jgi:hypothetical protein